MWTIAVLVGLLDVASPATPSQIDTARDGALSEKYQRTLPRYGEEGGGEGSADAEGRTGSGSGSGSISERPHRRLVRIRPNGKWTGQGGGDEAPRVPLDRGSSAGEPGGIGTVISFVLWAVIFVVVAIGVFWIISELASREDDAKEKDDDARAKTKPAAIDLAVIEKPLGDADELARQGNYTEAIHTLLLRTLQELVRSNAVRVAPSSTSREVLARVPLLADAREALADLISAVEITFFGTTLATQGDYERCREQFGRFATAFKQSNARGAA